jgi:hypothetical protein
MSYERFKIQHDPWLMAKTANPAMERSFERAKLAPLAALAISPRREPEIANAERPLPEPFIDFVAERAAMAEGGGVPAIYAVAFAKMQARPPRTMSVDRWYEAINDAGLFLDAWGKTAEKCGWSADDLFGPDCLVWSLDGKLLLSLDHNRAILPTGHRINRPSSLRRAG